MAPCLSAAARTSKTISGGTGFFFCLLSSNLFLSLYECRSDSQLKRNASMDSGELTMDVTREIRFAVVMYGGVSLAIYINGVSQELLQLGLATAEDPLNAGHPLEAELEGTAATYRKLAQLLSLSDDDRLALEAKAHDSPGAVLDSAHLPRTL